MNIILCGPPFCGKSKLGQEAAQKLGWVFKDTDLLLEEFYQQEKNVSLTYREIYRIEGNEIFRHYENRAVTSLEGCRHNLIALGGGSLGHSENIKILKRLGRILYLKTSLDILKERLMSSPLPSYLENEPDPWIAYQTHIKSRCGIYEQCADKIIETAVLSESQIISAIIETGQNRN